MARQIALEGWRSPGSWRAILRSGMIVLSLGAPARAASSAPESATATDSTRTAEVRVVRASGPISVDGNLAEAAWQAAPAISGFKQRDPNEGAEPSQQT